MKIVLAKNIGFCFGVSRAVKIARNIVATRKNNIYSLGPIIHNPQVVKELSRKGLKPIDKLPRKIPENATIIMRTHGITAQLQKKLAGTKLKLVDTTCPFVRRAQEIVQELSREKYQIIILGDKKHPEVESLVSYGNEQTYVINSLAELKKVPLKKKISFLSQTTQSRQLFETIAEYLKKKNPEVKIFDTICQSSTSRQDEAKKIAKKVDLLLVVGGKNSANTRRLVRVASQFCRVKQIENHRQLKNTWLNKVNTLGIISGASTPQKIIYDLIKHLQKKVKNTKIVPPGEFRAITGGKYDDRRYCARRIRTVNG